MLWTVLVDGDMTTWPIGAPVVALAVVVSLMMGGPTATRWRISGVPGFFIYFVWESFLGAVDVARRTFHPRLPMEPILVEYQLRLPGGHGKVFFANVVSLLPGTLSAELKSGSLVIHVLDGSGPFLRGLRDLERRVARLYGHDIGEPEGYVTPIKLEE